MFMQAMLNQGVFSTQQTQLVKGEAACAASERTRKMTIIGKGSATWTKDGQWIDESTSQKKRLMLTEDPKTFVALQEDSKNRTWYEAIRDHLTHITVQDKKRGSAGESFSVNIGSLSKRTHLCFLTILLMRFTGRLTLELVEQRARIAGESTTALDRIIENGRKRAIELGIDPQDKTKELKEVLHTVLKSRRLSKGIFVKKGETIYVAHKSTNNRFSLEEKSDLLGEGTYGTVFKIVNLGTEDTRAFKIAKQADKKSGILNEYTLLKHIHQNGPVVGIQRAPHFVIDLLHRAFGLGYVATQYDFNLNDLNFLKKTAMPVKLEKARALFNGVSYLHDHGIVHCDIKPANCSSEKGELQLADFGHARRCENVSLEQPLGVFTPYFTSSSDEEKSTKIALAYSMHNLAKGKIQDPLAKAVILQNAIDYPTIKIDKEAAKMTIASLLMNLSRDKILAKDIDLDRYQDEFEKLKKNPRLMRTIRLDISKFILTQKQLDQLKTESIALCKRHDVYGLGVTLLCIFLGYQFIRPERLGAALRKLSKDPALASINPGLTALLKQMLNPNGTKRPSIKEAYDQYQQLMSSSYGSSVR